MKYSAFGNTGLRVSQAALGTGNFGTGWGYGADPEVATAVFNAYAARQQASRTNRLAADA